MSSMSLHKEICPKCGKEQDVERYNSINDYHKELFPRIVDKSIFDYECVSCKEKIHAPYPLLFHKMGIRDIQIGYKIRPIPIDFFNPILVSIEGSYVKNICECYDNEDEFANRVKEILNQNYK